MNENDVSRYFDDELPEGFWDIVKKHALGARADDPIESAYVLCADTRDLVQEIFDPAAREWSTFRIMRQLHIAIDMLIDAKRLASMNLGTW